MAEFIINITNAEINATKIGELKTALERIESEIFSITNSLSLNSGATNGIKESMRNVASQVGDNSRVMGLMSTKMLEILSVYKNSEQAITSNRNGLAVDDATETSEGNICSSTAVNGRIQEETGGNTGEYSGEYTTSNGTRFRIGEPQQPRWEPYEQYDWDYAYDPNARATWDDYVNWAKWAFLNEGAQYGGWVLGRHMPDAIKTYEHYRLASGRDLTIDYAKAYEQDGSIQRAVDQYIRETQRMVEEMIADGQQAPFSITGDLMPVGGSNYPETENWQKAIGAHQIWISADVTIDENGNICMNTTVHEIDRYNFNAGMADIASGAPDDENGRFERLGWAKSFNTVGSVEFDVQWQPGDVEAGTTQEMTSGR